MPTGVGGLGEVGRGQIRAGEGDDKGGWIEPGR